MAEEFKKGDVVVLKSGGPRMTVSQVGVSALSNEPTVWCVWFEKTKKYDDTFDPETIKKASDTGPSIGVISTGRG